MNEVITDTETMRYDDLVQARKDTHRYVTKLNPNFDTDKKRTRFTYVDPITNAETTAKELSMKFGIPVRNIYQRRYNNNPIIRKCEIDGWRKMESEKITKSESAKVVSIKSEEPKVKTSKDEIVSTIANTIDYMLTSGNLEAVKKLTAILRAI